MNTNQIILNQVNLGKLKSENEFYELNEFKLEA